MPFPFGLPEDARFFKTQASFPLSVSVKCGKMQMALPKR